MEKPKFKNIRESSIVKVFWREGENIEDTYWLLTKKVVYPERYRRVNLYRILKKAEYIGGL